MLVFEARGPERCLSEQPNGRTAAALVGFGELDWPRTA